MYVFSIKIEKNKFHKKSNKYLCKLDAIKKIYTM